MGFEEPHSSTFPSSPGGQLTTLSNRPGSFTHSRADTDSGEELQSMNTTAFSLLERRSVTVGLNVPRIVALFRGLKYGGQLQRQWKERTANNVNPGNPEWTSPLEFRLRFELGVLLEDVQRYLSWSPMQ
jgi:hypothetical protein